jgi:glyoxylase-like metal-dependent hydrolase (beta-lactamase superfamily II)
MQLFSREAAELTGAPSEFGGVSVDFEGFHVDRALGDGDVVDLGGGVRLYAFETPGHSRCSMVAYEPERKWLFPGDSLHFPSLADDGLVFTASESFVVYQQSLQKLADLEVSLCGWEHHGVRTGEDARHVIRSGLEFTIAYRNRVLEILSRCGDPELAAKEVSRDWLSRAQFPFLPERVMLHIARGIVTNAVNEKLC